MEETKGVRGEGCGHTCVDMHKFCPKNCCFIKCILVVVVLCGVFAAGFAAGGEEGDGRGRHEGYGKSEGYRGEHQMMRSSESGDEMGGWDSPADPTENVQVMYRTVSQPATHTSVATATLQK